MNNKRKRKYETIGLVSFTKYAFEKLNRSIEMAFVCDAYVVVIQYIFSQLLNDRPFSIDKFGTFVKHKDTNGKNGIYFKINDDLFHVLKNKKKLEKIKEKV